MTKKDFILALCKTIGKPVSQYSSHDGYTCLKLKNGQFVDVYCDRCGTTGTCSLKLKFRTDTVGQTELKKAKRFVNDLAWNKADIYESKPKTRPWNHNTTVLRIRTHFYWPWNQQDDNYLYW